MQELVDKTRHCYAALQATFHLVSINSFPTRPSMQELVDKTQQFVEGTVRVKLYKVGTGSVRSGGHGTGGTGGSDMQRQRQLHAAEAASATCSNFQQPAAGAPAADGATLLLHQLLGESIAAAGREREPSTPPVQVQGGLSFQPPAHPPCRAT